MDPKLKSVVTGACRAFELPERLPIWDLRVPLDRLLLWSFEGRREWGSCIVQRNWRLVLQHPTPGEKEPTLVITPTCKVEDHQHYVGFAHVHLPDPVTHIPYLGFSALDYAAAITDGDLLSLVINGPEVFALVRSSDRTVKRRPVSLCEAQAWERRFPNELVRRRGQGALDEALWAVNRELCLELGLAFYRGRWGQPLQLVLRP